MLVVGLETIEPALRKHAAARRPMDRWVELAEAARWHNILAARTTFPTADAIKGTDLTCFNIGENNFRLLTRIFYQSQTVRVRELLTHAQYTKHYA